MCENATGFIAVLVNVRLRGSILCRRSVIEGAQVWAEQVRPAGAEQVENRDSKACAWAAGTWAAGGLFLGKPDSEALKSGETGDKC